MTLFDEILANRGLNAENREAFLNPDYSLGHDPFALPDMNAAVTRLVKAHQRGDKITVYGDYDIDGLTATTLMYEALKNFGFKDVETFIPNRFVEGFGLNLGAVKNIAANGTKLILTVDCGSQSEAEIKLANELGLDVIITDHHVAAEIQPPAVAVVNPKRIDSNYPFVDLAGVGVAFKLVQALQTRLGGIDDGQEKWLLDLVALGTVCDVVSLTGENRANVYWGLKVLQKTRRAGLRALMAVAGVETDKINSRTLGFVLGPRMNAAGRLETAQHALDMLTSCESMEAYKKAQYLDELNKTRQVEQRKILKEASLLAEHADDPVLVLSNPDWNHGIVGIVAAKLLEKYKKPVFLLQELGDNSKGSARSFGDFSAVEAIEATRDIISKGGGHRLAAGVSMPTVKIDDFRKRVNNLYKSKKLSDQASLLLPQADATATLGEVDESFVGQLVQMEPFGHDNPQPILHTNDLVVINVKRMGNEEQHLKLELSDSSRHQMQFIAFNAPDHFFVEPGARVSIWYQPDINEWRGRRSVEGRLLHLEVSD